MAKKTSSKKDKAPKEKPNAIHIRLENSEGIQGKKDLLNSEINLLKIFQSIENFGRLRNEETKNKKLIQKRAKEIKTNLNKLSILLPNLKVPKMLKDEVKKIRTKKPTLQFEVPKTKSKIEQELLEIQQKLKNLNQEYPNP